MVAEFLRSQAPSLIGAILLWGALGAVAGALLGWAAYAAAGRGRAWTLEAPGAKWARALAALWLIATWAALAGTMGGCEGLTRATERVVARSPFRTEGLDRAGAFGAAAAFWLDLYLQNAEAAGPRPLTEPQARAFQAYLKDESVFDLRAFLGRLDRAEARIVHEAVPSCREAVRAKLGVPEGRFVNALLDYALEVILRRRLRGELRATFEGVGVDVDRFFAALPASARATELATYIVEEALVPAVVRPVRSMARGQQLLSAILMAAALALPLAVFWIARRARNVTRNNWHSP